MAKKPANRPPAPAHLAPLPPGATIGILGGGQLGRMLAIAAARLGLKTHIYSDGRDACAFDVAHAHTIGDYDDISAVEAFARHVDVVTYEFENVPLEAAAAAERAKPVRPGPLALEVAQDRLTEKQFMTGLGLPVAPFAGIATDCGAFVNIHRGNQQALRIGKSRLDQRLPHPSARSRDGDPRDHC